MRITLWSLVEKLAPVIALEQALEACAPVPGLEDFFDPAGALAARQEARRLAREIARRHYRLGVEIGAVLERLDLDAEAWPSKIGKVFRRVAAQIRRRHKLPPPAPMMLATANEEMDDRIPGNVMGDAPLAVSGS